MSFRINQTFSHLSPQSISYSRNMLSCCPEVCSLSGKLSGEVPFWVLEAPPLYSAGAEPGDGRGPPRGAWARFSEAPAPLPWRSVGQTRLPTSAALRGFSLTRLTQLRRAGRRRKKRRRRGRSPRRVVQGWGRRPAGTPEH